MGRLKDVRFRWPQSGERPSVRLDRWLVAATVAVFSLIGADHPTSLSTVAPGVPSSPPILTIQSVTGLVPIRKVAEVWQQRDITVSQDPPLSVRWPMAVALPSHNRFRVTWDTSNPPSFVILLMYSRGELNQHGIPLAQHVFMCAPNRSATEAGGCIY